MNKKLVKNFVFVGLIALIVCANMLTAIATETYTWEQKASMRTARYRHCLVATNDSLYAIGGANPTFVITNSVEKYDPNTNAWETVADMLIPRMYFGATFYDGKIYIFGGGTSDGRTNKAESYDISTNIWSSIPAMPRIRTNLKSVVVNDKIYILGGEDGTGTNLSEVDVYNPSSDTWETVTNLPNARNQGLFEAIGNKIYAFGGLTDGTYNKIVDVYDTETGTWSIAGSMLNTKHYEYHHSAVVNGKIYSMFDDDAGIGTEVYDPSTDEWSLVENFYVNQYNNTASAVLTNKIFICGGRYLSADFKKDLFEITISHALPLSPTNLTATPGDAQVLLNWDLVTDADSYTVKRATTAGGPYTVIAENITETSYLDTTIVNGTTYYYVVTAVNTSGESNPSNEASATPIAPIVNRALLNITMQDSLIKEYDLSMNQVNSFIDWYNSSTGSELYTVEKFANIGPFLSRKDYLVKGKIVCFEVMEYIN